LFADAKGNPRRLIEPHSVSLVQNGGLHRGAARRGRRGRTFESRPGQHSACPYTSPTSTALRHPA
jgi:hypothetical protein